MVHRVGACRGLMGKICPRDLFEIGAILGLLLSLELSCGLVRLVEVPWWSGSIDGGVVRVMMRVGERVVALTL